MDKKIEKNGSLGFKLSLLFALLMLVSIGSVNIVVNHFIRNSEGVVAENNNFTMNIRGASALENELNNICSNSFELLDMLSIIAESGNRTLFNQTQSQFFYRNSDIAGVILSSNSAFKLKILNNSFFKENNLDKNLVNNILVACKDQVNDACNGKNSAVNVSNVLGYDLVALFIPIDKNSKQCAIIIFQTEKLSELVSLGVKTNNNTIVMDNQGKFLLINDDDEEVETFYSEEYNPVSEKILSSTENNTQFEFKGADKKKYFGAVSKLDSYNIYVATVVQKKYVYEALDKTIVNNIFLCFVILGLTVFVILMYTHFNISKPLKLLKNAVEGINKGHFNNNYIQELNTRRHDEIGILNTGITNEREFLNTFAKFTNQNVAKAIATKSIDFEPHPKDITIFFSDIRGFTAISDGFKKKYGGNSAAYIISFLNDYMSRMVECVTLSNGIIDKFEGDAIMAVWGILRNENLDFNSITDETERNKRKAAHIANVQTDAINCITGSIAMRYALMEYNKNVTDINDDTQIYKPHIRIGCGINTGRASVGLMGSKDKMEYTSIGDAVNFASRTEASNKACGTDILISEDTYNLLKRKYIRCEENNFTIPAGYESKEIIVEKIPVSFEVKGKGEQHFYGVVNMPNLDIEEFFKQNNSDFKADKDCAIACGKTGPKTLSEVRKILGIPTPNFGKVNLNEEENKVTVK